MVLKLALQQKRITARCSVFFPLPFRHGQNRQVTSHREYVPHCERFELKLGMRVEEGLLNTFPKFHGDRATSTMFSQRCNKTYRSDLVLSIVAKKKNCNY